MWKSVKCTIHRYNPSVLNRINNKKWETNINLFYLNNVLTENLNNKQSVVNYPLPSPPLIKCHTHLTFWKLLGTVFCDFSQIFTTFLNFLRFSLLFFGFVNSINFLKKTLFSDQLSFWLKIWSFSYIRTVLNVIFIILKPFLTL